MQPGSVGRRMVSIDGAFFHGDARKPASRSRSGGISGGQRSIAPSRNTARPWPTPCTGSRSPVAVIGPPALGPRSARAPPASGRRARRARVRPAAPGGAASRPGRRSSRRSHGSPPIASHARLGAPGPAEPHGHASRGDRGNSLRHRSIPLSLSKSKSWSLRQTRCGSLLALLVRENRMICPLRRVAAPLEKRGFEIARDFERPIINRACRRLRVAFDNGLPEAGEPTREKGRFELADLLVHGEHIAAIPGLHTQGGAPEFLHPGYMGIPLLAKDLAVDRSEHWVTADLCIKALQQRGKRLLGDASVFHCVARSARGV